MAIVTFWSNTKKETAQTLSMIAIASHIAVENNSKILIVDTNLNDPTIENAFIKDTKAGNKEIIKKLSSGKIDIGTGFEGLSKMLVSGKHSPEIIKDYAHIIYRERLEVMLSFKGTSDDEIKRVKSTYTELIKLANQKYDYVFVDATKGFDDPITNEILAMSDVVVHNFTQRQKDMDDYLALKANNDVFQMERVLPLVGRYDRYSKYTKKNIARYLDEKKDIPAVSYNTLFFESANNGGIGEYFLKFRKSLISSQDRNVVFIDEVENAAERLIFKVQESLMMKRR